VKVRTRKLLASAALRRAATAENLQAAQARITTMTSEVDYDQVNTP
jgi:hypothetical protein